MTIDMSRPTIYPVLRYKDSAAALEFLATAFGFLPGEVNTDDRGAATGLDECDRAYAAVPPLSGNAARTNSDGVQPPRLRNSRTRWLWSA